MVVAGMDALSESLRKHFDTSGKSAALFHRRAICKTPMALPDNGPFGAIAGKKSLPTIEVAPARHSEGSPARCRAARAIATARSIVAKENRSSNGTESRLKLRTLMTSSSVSKGKTAESVRRPATLI